MKHSLRCASALIGLLTVAQLTNAAVDPRNIIAVLDGTQNFGTTRRAINFYDVTSIGSNGATNPSGVFGSGPLFSVWVGYEDSTSQNFEDIDTFTVNPINGTIYAVAFDSGPAGVVDSAGDTQGDLDLYRIDYQELLNDFVTNNRAQGTMYAPTAGPDGAANPTHPQNGGNTVNIANAITKVGEVGRTQGSEFFDRDVEFIDPQTLVLIDNEQDSSDTASEDHELRVIERVSTSNGAASADTSDSNSIEGGYNAQTSESWESDRAALLNMDFASGSPVGFSEPEDIALAKRDGVVGVWVAETDGGGDDLSFFELSGISSPAGDAVATKSTFDGLGESRSLDQDPELSTTTNDGSHDFIKVDENGNLLIGESGFFDLPQAEPTVQRLNVAQYQSGNVDLSSDTWDDLGDDSGSAGLGSSTGDTLDDDLAAPFTFGDLTNTFNGGTGFSADDDSDVTDGRFTTYDPGTNILYVFDIDTGGLPNVVADVYGINLETGEIVYEELNATNHFLVEHGIRQFLRGDTDGDGDVDADDIDAFVAAENLNDALTDEMYDLTGDNGLAAIGGASAADMAELIRNILGTEFGDANLDGVISAADLSITSGNLGSSGLGWAGGDFNGDGIVSAADLSIVSGNFGFNNMAMGASAAGAQLVAGGAAAVPEPSTMVASLIGGLVLLIGAHCRRKNVAVA